MPFDECPFLFAHSATQRPLVAISACLTGAAVRYDGTDKYQPGLDGWLRDHIELLPICPELDAGLGVPRPPVQLVETPTGLRALGRDDRVLDVTDALRRSARARCDALQSLPLCGYLWKSRSPSCGLHSTPLFDASGVERGTGSGLQAEAVAAALPWLAMAEEGVLQQQTAARRFLLGCRLVFDCLHAGNVDAVTVARHYQSLLAGIEPAVLGLLLRRDDRHGIVAAIVRNVMTLPEAVLRQRLPQQR